MHYGRNRTLDKGKTPDMNLPQKRRNAIEMVILTKNSKIFIKAKMTVSKSYPLGLVYFMISCILRVCAYINHKISLQYDLYSEHLFWLIITFL